MGLTLFVVKDHAGGASEQLGGKAKRQSQASTPISSVLKNRNILLTSLVLMVGAAGRGTGINMTYLVPFFMNNSASAHRAAASS